MSYAFLCEKCNGEAPWRLTRIGDVVTSWACDQHLAWVVWGLQRAGETELSITPNYQHPEPPKAT